MNTAALHHAPPMEEEQRSRSLRVVLLMEVWERFGFYCVQSICVLFLVNRMGFADDHAALLWGAFTAMNYAMPAIGGWVGDQIIGSRRAMTLGMIVLLAGYGGLSIPTESHQMIYLSLAVVSIGTGMFKPNAASLVHHIQEGGRKGVDVAFTLYYMSICIGSSLALVFTPLVREWLGWHAALLTGSLGLAFGLVNLFFSRKVLHHVGSAPDFRPLDMPKVIVAVVGAVALVATMSILFGYPAIVKNVVWAAGVIALGVWALVYRSAKPQQRVGLGLLYLLTLETMLFFVFNQQVGTSLTLFASRCVDPQFRILGMPIISLLPGQFQAFNTLWIVAATPFVTMLYSRLDDRGIYVPIPAKFVIGAVLLALCFLIWWSSTFLSDGQRVSPWVMVAGYGAFSLGEMMLSALGLAAVARYAPKERSGLLMGTCYVTRGVAMYIGSILASLAPVDATQATSMATMLDIYGGLFRLLFFIAIGGVATFLLLVPVALRWDARHKAGR